MGILNVTPDSFSDGGRFAAVERALARAYEMADQGAAIVDVGGESTRPGADEVSAGEELDRVMPVIEALVSGSDDRPPLGVPVSIDTRKALVADRALQAGAAMVNDVTAAEDPAMVEVLRSHGSGVPVVIMHMRGEPRNMQDNPRYDDAVAEIGDYLAARAESLSASGIAPERIVVDPGIGFGKRLVDNLFLLKNIDALRALGYPVLVGASRKSFIGHLVDGPAPDRLAGSLAAAARCYHAGAEFVRVHDVRETVHLFEVLHAIDHPEQRTGDVS